MYCKVMASATLKAVLQTLLVIGNALNVDTNYGNAAGFRLDTLLKLHDVKVPHHKPHPHTHIETESAVCRQRLAAP